MPDAIPKRLWVVLTLALVAVGMLTILVVSRRGPDGSTTTVGELDDFPVGSVTLVAFDARLTNRVPILHEASKPSTVRVRAFIVNHPTEGLLALWERDPHRGCRVSLTAELPPDPDWHPPTESVFYNPCHGEQYDLAGRYITGPAPRGLDRFGVTILGDHVIIDAADLRLGPPR